MNKNFIKKVKKKKKKKEVLRNSIKNGLESFSSQNHQINEIIF